MYNRPLMSYQPVELISITISPYISSTSNSLKQISHLRSKKLKVQNFLRWTPSEQLKPEPKSSPQSSVHSIPVGMTYDITLLPLYGIGGKINSVVFQLILLSFGFSWTTRGECEQGPDIPSGDIPPHYNMISIIY